MQVTILGSGDALGMPVPLCECEYCTESDPRRRPALLVEAGDTTIVLDAGPDLPAQLRSAGVTEPDAIFVTHHHYDHVGGLWELRHAQMPVTDHVLDPTVYADAGHPPRTDIPVYLTERAQTHLENQHEALREVLADESLQPGTSLEFGAVTVTPFPVDHARPQFHTQGFRLDTPDASVVYAPDLRDWLPDREHGEQYRGADLLVVEGAGLFRAAPHGPSDLLAAAISDADAATTVLVNINEHLHRQHTPTLNDRANTLGYDLSVDDATYTLP